jgi:hypothetical protein
MTIAIYWIHIGFWWVNIFWIPFWIFFVLFAEKKEKSGV